MGILCAIIEFPLRQPVAIFLLVLVIILLAPMLLSRLKIPHIVGMIVAGMIVGPHGFNILERDASFLIFGEVGILYLMFLAAVEIDMYNLKLNSKKGIIFGFITFLIPMAGGLLASRYLFDTSWITALLIASMYASHTLISYPVITRFGLTNSRPVVISICATIVSVLLALVALAEVVSISHNGSPSWMGIAILLGGVIAYTVGLGLVIPWLTRFFFKKFNDNITQFIYILSVMIFSSLVAQLIGLEAILGAFFAGLVLNRYIPGRSPLMNRIEFVGNAIFIPYFLIGVGMLINVSVIINGLTVLKIAFIMIATALGCKWVAAYISQKAFGMSAVDRNIMFGLTSGKAAATIAAAMVGFQYGLISENLMNAAVLMILVCCAVASICTERASLKLRMDITEEELKTDTAYRSRPPRQLVAVSNPITAENLMKLSICMRYSKHEHSSIVLFIRNSDDAKSIAVGRSAVAMAVKAAAAADIKADEIERYDMNIVAGLTNVAKERDCSEIVIGLHRKSNIVDSFYGSMTEQLLRSTNKMVIISRCFIPVNTISRIVVVVPRNAEYETGFRMWVCRMGNLASQIGCRIIFIAYKDTIPYIQGVLTDGRYMIRHSFREMESWDDFIMISARIKEDDLLAVVEARHTSLSYSHEMENIPAFLGRYFSGHNVMVVYPEQFGPGASLPTPIDPLTQSMSTSPTPWLLSFRRWRGALRRPRRRGRGNLDL